MALRRSALALVMTGAVGIGLGCGGPPARSPEGTLAVVPPVPIAAKTTTEPTAPKRPDTVVAWLHVDDPDGMLDLLGVTGPQAQHQPWTHELLPYLELVDLRQPIDGVLVAVGPGKHDLEPAVRLSFRNTKALVERMGKELKLREDGDRIFARPKHGHDTQDDADTKGDDAFVCDFSQAGRAADTAVCGTAKAVDAVVDWLRTGPTPREEDSANVVKGAPIARFVGYGAAARKLFAKELDPSPGGSDSELAAVLADARLLSLDLVRDENKLGFSAALRLDDTRSAFTKDLLEAPNAEAAPDAFHKIWQDTSAAVFVPGGGAVPKWIADIVASIQMTSGIPEAQRERVKTASKAIGDAFRKPAAIGYGVRTDRAKAALSTVRAAKDQEKALRALEEALEPQIVYALAIDAAAAERAMRDLASAWNAVSQEQRGTPPHPPNAAGNGFSPHPKFAVRTAAAKWALPKGSFFFEETKVDWLHTAPSPTGAQTKPATKTEYTLHVPQGNVVWGITCPEEKTCVDGAKRVLGASPAGTVKREPDELFQRKGILCGGYLSTLVGALSMHRYGLAGGGSGSGLADTLAEIERDLSAPRMVLPFVVTTRKAEAGGTLVFEIRGERDAFRTLGEHIGISGSSVIGIIMMLGALGH